MRTILGLVVVNLLASAAVARAQGILYSLEGPGDPGYAVAGLGDVDGDGIGDVAASGDNDVSVYSGFDQTILFTIAGAQPNDAMGAAICAAGDVDLDGVDDLLVGAPGPLGPGAAVIASGRTGTIIWSAQGAVVASKFGRHVASAGDVNNDGVVDWMVDAGLDSVTVPGWTGVASVYSGASGTALHQLVFPNGPSGSAGFGVSGIGDIDADGFDDVAYATYEYVGGFGTNRYAVQVISAANWQLRFSLSGGATEDHFGDSAVSEAGDVDGDGTPDVLVGARDGANKKGAAWVFSGVDAHVVHALTGNPVGGSFGGVDSLGDYDGDGHDDFLVADSDEKPPGNEGVLRLYSGASGSVLAKYVGEPHTKTGFSMACAGDINGDGRLDVIAGGIGSDGTDVTDAAYVFSTTCGSATTVGSGCPNASGLVPQLVLGGCFTPAGSITLNLVAGVGPTVALLVAGGTTPASIPLGGGCTLAMQLPVATWPVAVGPFALASIVQTLPIAPSLPDLRLQAFVPAPGTALGFSATNGILLDID